MLLELDVFGLFITLVNGIGLHTPFMLDCDRRNGHIYFLFNRNNKSMKEMFTFTIHVQCRGMDYRRLVHFM